MLMQGTWSTLHLRPENKLKNASVGCNPEEFKLMLSLLKVVSFVKDNFFSLFSYSVPHPLVYQTHEEFVQTYLAKMTVPQVAKAEAIESKYVPITLPPLPYIIDWRDTGFVSEVMTQVVGFYVSLQTCKKQEH